ncbi:hypothetical protein AAMO2058_000792300 [Amorphochlora amoebiformis]
MKRFPSIAYAPSLVSLCFAELVGTFFFTFIESMIVVTSGDIVDEAMSLDRVVVIAIGGGLVYYGLLYLTMTITDGHGCYLHPGLTFSLIAVDLFLQVPVGLEVFVGLVCIALQLTAATLGSLGARYCVPNPDQGAERMGISQPNLGSDDGQVWCMELILSLFFALVVMSVRSNETRRSSVLIAVSYMATRLLSFPLSFSTLNPARSLGPYAASGFTGSPGFLWIDFSAPFIGCVLGSIVFYILKYDTLATGMLQGRSSS